MNCFIHPHEGKSHLKRSIPIKMRAYPRYGAPVKVLIIHDQDSNDCIQLKEELMSLCKSRFNIPVVIRIACKELENWYLGDMYAIECVYPESKASKLIGKAKYRNPDAVFGAFEIEQMTRNFSKTHASREIPKYMNIERNNSESFKHFIAGIRKIISI